MYIPAGKQKIALLFALLALVILSACAPGGGAASPNSSLSNVPSGTGTTPEPGTDGKPQPAPNGHSESIITTNDIAYVGSDNGIVYALEASDGKILWQYKAGGPALVYAAANGAVYATNENTLYALNASNGTLLWQYQASTEISQVQVSDGVVYANTAATGNTSTLAALRVTDGTLLWHYSLATVIPGLLGVINGVVYDMQASDVPPSPNATSIIHALRASDAHVLWQASIEGSDGLVDGTPVESSGILYFATSSGTIYALSADTGQQLWHAGQPDERPFAPVPISPTVTNGFVYVGDTEGISVYRASNGARQWQYKSSSPGPFPPQPTVADGVVYYGGNGLIVALRATDGSQIWQQAQPTSTFGPLVVMDGLVISDFGPVFALRASDGALVWQQSINPDGIGTPAGGPEAIGGGTVYIGSDDGTVHAIRVSDGKLLWHYAIPELPVPTPPVYIASVTFSPATTYQQALETVTNLGLKTFALCTAQWTTGDNKDLFAEGHELTVQATANSAPLWMNRLRSTPGVQNTQSLDGPISCPIMRPGNEPPYLDEKQAGTYLQVTFAGAISYDAALDGVNGLWFRLADPCYEQARASGAKPTWHPMSQADTFEKTQMLVLATTSVNATTWMSQLQALAGVQKVTVPFTASC